MDPGDYGCVLDFLLFIRLKESRYISAAPFCLFFQNNSLSSLVHQTDILNEIHFLLHNKGTLMLVFV